MGSNCKSEKIQGQSENKSTFKSCQLPPFGPQLAPFSLLAFHLSKCATWPLFFFFFLFPAELLSLVTHGRRLLYEFLSLECNIRRTRGTTGCQNPRFRPLATPSMLLSRAVRHVVLTGPCLSGAFFGDLTIGSLGSRHQPAVLELLFMLIPRLAVEVAEKISLFSYYTML